MICERCSSNHLMVRWDTLMTSLPPKYPVDCRVCGHRMHLTFEQIVTVDVQVPKTAEAIVPDPARVVLDLVHDIPGAEIVLERERYVIRLPR